MRTSVTRSTGRSTALRPPVRGAGADIDLVSKLVRSASVILRRPAQFDVPNRTIDGDPGDIAGLAEGLRKHHLDVAAQVLADGETRTRIGVGGQQVEIRCRGAKAVADLHAVESNRTAGEAQQLSREQHQQLTPRDVGLHNRAGVDALSGEQQRHELVLTDPGTSEARLQRLGRSAHFEGDVVALDARLQRDIDRWLDARGAREVDGAAHDFVGAASEEHVAAFSNRQAPCWNRLGNRADDPEICGYVETAVVVVDDNLFRRFDVDIEEDAIEEASVGGRGGNGRSRLHADQKLGGQAHRLAVRAAQNGEASGQRGRLVREVEPEVGIDLAAQVFGHFDSKSASANRNGSTGDGEFRILDAARHRAACRRLRSR